MSVGVVDKTTGDRIQTAGDPLDKVGNLANLTTTAKDNAVAAINEVNAGLAGKQATLTFDNVPTDGSNNPVKSDGIYDALAGKQAVPTEISYADWQQLTPQQQESGSWLVQGVPSANLSTRVSALESGKQDKTDNTLATTTKTVVGAINEVNSNIANLGGIVDVTNQFISIKSPNNIYVSELHVGDNGDATLLIDEKSGDNTLSSLRLNLSVYNKRLTLAYYDGSSWQSETIHQFS